MTRFDRYVEAVFPIVFWPCIAAKRRGTVVRVLAFSLGWLWTLPAVVVLVAIPLLVWGFPVRLWEMAYGEAS